MNSSSKLNGWFSVESFISALIWEIWHEIKIVALIYVINFHATVLQQSAGELSWQKIVLEGILKKWGGEIEHTKIIHDERTYQK